ncbi:MAG TPA: TrbG/VirB9 family P-type conjugative transfer protein [Steroidobacteraceae bacterium]|nr:TrbG/VirB9 family P-type conjugative transfer protein [Steroidobacteraceae bacterium]
MRHPLAGATPPRRGWFLATLISFLLSSVARAETLPSPGLVDSRIRVVEYSRDEVYRLHGYVGYQIDLQFETGEVFVGMGAGDLQGLSFVPQDNHLFIKPKAARISTNLTVLTSRRSYQFDYTATLRRPGPVDTTVIYALRFIYGQSEERSAESVRRLLEGAQASRTRNVDYWYCGSAALKPAAASDDGVHTRLKFGRRGEQPAIFILNEDGSESLLNFSMDNEDVVIHRVARELILRRGKLAGRVFNKGYSGSGERLPTGTVSPEVERATRSDAHDRKE